MTAKTLTWPDKRLRSVAGNVEKITDVTLVIWDQMIAIMDAMPGVGLAAVQLGIMQRLAVVDASGERGQAIRMANPEILHLSAKLNTLDEASPCLPGVSACIERPRAVTVRFVNAQGNVEDRDLVGLWATSVQHQIDHLAGKMYFDHLSGVKRQMLLKRAAKLARRP